MWRTVIVNRGERITLSQNRLVVYCDALEQKIPLGDIYALVLENGAASVSVSVLAALAKMGAHVYFCDEKHLPVGVSYPLNPYFSPLATVEKQLKLTRAFKDELWAAIVRQKILNQALCLKHRGAAKERIDELKAIAASVTPGDKNNREAVAARKYFPALFGFTFRRTDDDVTNAALNYGYSIVRSSVAKALVVHGYNGVLGLHHVGPGNPFNLADDLMEPLRPLVDQWTDAHCDELLESLTYSNRRELIALINMPVFFDGKKTRVRYALDLYVKSLTSAINENDPSLLKIPVLLPLDEFFEDEEDG